MRKNRGYIVFVISIHLLFQSCVKEDLTKLSDEFNWKPNFSLPVATVTMNSGNYVGVISFLEAYKLTNEILISETIEFNFTDIFSQEEYLEQLMFRYDIDNRFPARLEAYAYYLDDDFQIIKSLLANPPLEIPAPQVDSDGNIIKSTQVIHDEYVSQEDIASLLDVNYILIQVFIKELNQSPKVTSQIDDYDIEISVGIRAYLNIPVNE